MMVSCRTTREIINTDLSVEHGIKFDSMFYKSVNTDTEMVTKIQRIAYDSVITHITIMRYDTIFVDGSPVIKEKVEFDQVKISGDTMTEQVKDSIKASEVVLSDMTYNDTIQIERHEITQKKSSDNGNVVNFLIFIIVVLLSYICIDQINKR